MLEKIKTPEKKKMLVLFSAAALLIIVFCIIAFSIRTVSRKKTEKNIGGSFTPMEISGVSDIKCLNEEIAVYSVSSGKKGIMLLDGTVTEEADEDDIFTVSDEWRNCRIVAQGPRSEYLLLVDSGEGKIQKKQYHGPRTPEKTVYWDAEEGKVVYTDPEGNTEELSRAQTTLGNGLFPVKNSPDNDALYGYVDGNLNLMLSCIYTYAGDFSEGLAPVVKDGKLGYIDDSGKLIIPFDYSASADGQGYRFRNGMVPVCREGKYGIINRSGETVVTFVFDRILQGKNGKYIASRNGVWGVLKVNEDVFNAENTAVSDEETDSGLIRTFTVKTSGSPLNLRTKPDVNSQIIVKIPNGSQVEMTRAEGGWAYVQYAGYEGWVSADYIVEAAQNTGSAAEENID